MLTKHNCGIFVTRMLWRNIIQNQKYKNRLMSHHVHQRQLTLQDIPTPKRLPILGTGVEVFKAALNCRIHKYIDEKHKQLGPIFRNKMGPLDTVLIADPEVMRDIFINHEGKYPQHVVPDAWTLYNEKYNVKRGLFFMNGSEWLDMRRVMNKLMLKSNTDNWIQEPISQVADNFVSFWNNRCSSHGYEPDLDKELYKLSLDVILATMLGSTYSSNYKDFEELLKKFSKSVHGIFLYSTKMYIMPGKFYEKFGLPSWKGFERSITESLACGKQLVNEVYKLNNIGDGLASRMIKEGMSQEMVTRILIDLIIAAGDTTSFTAQWTLHLLSKNQNIIKTFLKTAPSSEDESNYVRCIIKESMRIYPAAGFVTRILDANSNIGGYTVPAGTILVMSLYTSGRNSEYFPDPLTFKPERWDKSVSESFKGVNVPLASIPFAMGARSCIGRKIAVAQLKHFIIKVLRNFKLQSLNKDTVDDIMQMIIRPSQKIRILIEPR